MARTLTVAAAQTGPVTETAEPAIVEAAIALIDEARAQAVRLLVFPELFLAPFFANRLVERFDGFFLAPGDPVHCAVDAQALLTPPAHRAIAP